MIAALGVRIKRGRGLRPAGASRPRRGSPPAPAPPAEAFCSPADGICKAADAVCSPADAGCSPADDRCSRADGICSLADGSCEAATGVCSLADDSCSPADDSCSLADGSCSPADSICSLADFICSVADFICGGAGGGGGGANLLWILRVTAALMPGAQCRERGHPARHERESAKAVRLYTSRSRDRGRREACWRTLWRAGCPRSRRSRRGARGSDATCGRACRR